MKFKRHIINCNCIGNPPDCMAVLSYYKYEDGYKDLSIHMQLNVYLPWYKRLGVAFNYLFNIYSKRCHWGETGLDEKGILDLKNFLDEVQND